MRDIILALSLFCHGDFYVIMDCYVCILTMKRIVSGTDLVVNEKGKKIKYNVKDAQNHSKRIWTQPKTIIHAEMVFLWHFVFSCF